MSGSVSKAAAVSRLPAALSFKHFRLRLESRSLYRTLYRVSRRCENVSANSQQKEVRLHIRSEFEAMKHITDEEHIKQLLRNGKHAVDNLEKMLNLAY